MAASAVQHTASTGANVASGHSAGLAVTALSFYDNGFCVMPVRPNGSKAPAFAWKPFMTERPTREQTGAWFMSGQYDGLGVVCGAASGSVCPVEMLEFEGRAVDEGLYDEFVTRMEAHGAGGLWRSIIDGYLERTPTGGIHVLYRVAFGDARPNTKLAARPATDGELAVNPGERVKVLIETRGEGGFVVTAPSNGRTHPTGRPWLLEYGGPGSVQVIDPDQRDTLYAIAASLNELRPTVTPERNRPQPAAGGRPGDAWAAVTDWAEILEPHGWVPAGMAGQHQAWLRPGKQSGISATTSDTGMYVWSTSAGLDTELPLTKFHVLAVLDHGGSYAEAARELARRGFGDHLTAVPAPAEVPAEPPAGDTGEFEQVDLSAYQFVDWDKAFEDQPEQVDWLYEPLLERGTLNSMYAKPGHGKSLVTLEVAVRLAIAGHHVIYLDNENRITDHVDRIQSMGYEPAQFKEHLHMLSFSQLPPLNTDEGSRHLLALSRKVSAELVVIDTTSRFVEGKENDSDTFLGLYRKTLVPLKGAGLTVLRLDHPGKDAEKGQRGSSAKDGDVDVIWKLTKTGEPSDDDPRIITCEKSRNTHTPQRITLAIMRDPDFRHEWNYDFGVVSPAGQEAADAKTLEAAGIPADWGRKRIRPALLTAGIQMSNTRVDAAQKYRKTSWPGEAE